MDSLIRTVRAKSPSYALLAWDLLLGVIVVMACLVMTSGFAGAEEVTKTIPSTVSLEPWVVAVIGGTLIPLVVGLVTKLGASSAVKAVTGLFLTALVTILNVIVTSNGTFVVRDVVVLFATTFVMHVASYYGAWKPLGGDAAPSAHIMPNKGIG